MAEFAETGGATAAALAVGAFPGQALAATSAIHPSSIPPHCPTNLRVDFGKPAATKVAYQHRVQIALVNLGHSACSMSGYPGQHASFALTYLLETPQEIQGELGAWGPNTHS